VSAENTRRVVGIGLGVLLVLAFAAFATGLDDPEVPDGSVAVVEDVDDGDVTQDDFDAAMEQVAASQGLRGGPPKPGDEQYEAFKEQALSDLLLQKWVQGEAEERGITASEREIDDELETIKEQNFNGSEKEFQRFLDESGLSEEDAIERVRLSVLSQKLQCQIVYPADLAERCVLNQQISPAEVVSEEDIEVVYEQQKSQYEQPESRDVRVIVNKDEEKVQQARDELEQDDSEESWKRVAEEFSTDEASSGNGGLRESVVEGQGDPAFDQAVFSATEGALVGPFETADGTFNLIQVVGITPAETQPLEEASKEIAQQLQSAQEQAKLSAFEEQLTAKWSERTFCAEDFIVEQCANFDQAAPDSCTLDDPSEIEAAAPEQAQQGCPPPVQSRNPAAPQELSEAENEERTQAQLQPLQQPYTLVPGGFPQGLPQRPLPTPPAEGAAAGGLPPGSVPIGPGAVPPTGAAPPTGAPPAPGGAPAAPPPTGP
jgi:peptidyl-prolyl cis-trans isomerase C